MNNKPDYNELRFALKRRVRAIEDDSLSFDPLEFIMRFTPRCCAALDRAEKLEEGLELMDKIMEHAWNGPHHYNFSGGIDTCLHNFEKWRKTLEEKK